MTTDRYPKLRSSKVNGSLIMGVAKGAGMIEPNLGTMLSYIIMDLNIPEDDFKEITSGVVADTYNCISVDSDESTSDTVVILSSKAGRTPDRSEYPAIRKAVLDICGELARDVVRNGEGTSHVIACNVCNYPGENAKLMAKKIVNSPLIKTAIAGNDPNVGRLASAIGSYMGKFEEGVVDTGWKDSLTIKIGEHIVFRNGNFELELGMEEKLSSYIKSRQFGEDTRYPEIESCVEIDLDFGVKGGKSAKVWGSDLTKEYVAVNADYRS
jgi:glutamate N-acetyltransferase/amino-acid N-acetyltransferase